ncbi:VOC family protein [Asanoa sp. NPDC049573]|uniref:VOC family protein n=1 Tax=Asanoa sp. NPDC049573 TaxID=3155396 RepID=UPI0034198B54
MTHLSRVVISTGSLPRALTFYGDLLDLPVAASGAGLATLAAGEGVSVLLHERPTAPSDTSVAASFVVPGLDAIVARWQGSGGAVVDPPAAQPWGERMAVVRDPDGHLVCLVDGS